MSGPGQCGSSFFFSRRKYKRLIKAVFPREVESSDLNDAEMERLTVYALTNAKMLPKIGMFLERRAGKKFARKEFAHVRVAVQIINQLVQTCHLDLRVFADSVVRLTKFLLRQTEAPDLQVTGCEMLIKFASTNQDDASQLHTLTPFVDDLVRLCHDSQPRPDLRQSIREAGLRAIFTIIQLVDSAGLAEQYGKLMPGVLVNMNVAPSTGDDMDRRVRDTAFRLFDDICRTLRPTLAPFILKPLFAYLDGNNCWASGGEAPSFVLESLEHLMHNMMPQHNYLIFIHMQARVEACCRQGADPSITLCTVRAVKMLAHGVRATPGPAFFRIFISVLEVMLFSLDALKRAGYDGRLDSEEHAGQLSAHQKLALLQQAIKDAASPKPRGGGGGQVEALRKLLEETVECMSVIGGKLQMLPQHLDALNEIATRCADKAATQRQAPPAAPAPADALELAFLHECWGREWVLRALKGVTHEGVRLSGGKTLPRPLLTLLVSWAYSGAPPPPAAAKPTAGSGARVREMVAQVLGDLLCGRPPRDAAGEGQQGQELAWNERVAAHQVPLLAAAVVDMACNEANEPSTSVQVHRLLVSLARNAPQPWVQLVLPALLDLERLALRDAHEGSALQALADRAHKSRASTMRARPDKQCERDEQVDGAAAEAAVTAVTGASQPAGVLVLAGGLSRSQREREEAWLREAERGREVAGVAASSARALLLAPVRRTVLTMVAASLLAAALALPCPGLEAHVRQVLVERRQAGDDSPSLRICDNGDLEVAEALDRRRQDLHTDTPLAGDDAGHDASVAGAPPHTTHVLDLTEMMHALGASFPHLARALAAHGTSHGAPLVRSGSVVSSQDGREPGVAGALSSAGAPPSTSSPPPLAPASHSGDANQGGGAGRDVGGGEALSQVSLDCILQGQEESVASEDAGMQCGRYSLHPARLIKQQLARMHASDACQEAGSAPGAGGGAGAAPALPSDTMAWLRSRARGRLEGTRSLARAIAAKPGGCSSPPDSASPGAADVAALAGALPARQAAGDDDQGASAEKELSEEEKEDDGEEGRGGQRQEGGVKEQEQRLEYGGTRGHAQPISLLEAHARSSLLEVSSATTAWASQDKVVAAHARRPPSSALKDERRAPAHRPAPEALRLNLSSQRLAELGRTSGGRALVSREDASREATPQHTPRSASSWPRGQLDRGVGSTSGKHSSAGVASPRGILSSPSGIAASPRAVRVSFSPRAVQGTLSPGLPPWR